MSVPYLLMNYVPWGAGSPKPALLVWFEHRYPTLYGVGVTSGQPFDPVAFARVFPTETDVAWVFVEWVDALAYLCQTGIDRDGFREVLIDNPEAALSECELGEAATLAPLLARMAAGSTLPKTAALGALAYLVRDEFPDLEVQLEKGQLALSTDEGPLLTRLELRRSPLSPHDWQVFTRQPGRPGRSITWLAAEDCRTTLRTGLAPWVS